MAKVVASRFALLKVEGDDDDKEKKAAQKATNAQTNKKKNKKKKGGQQDEEVNFLNPFPFAHRSKSQKSDWIQQMPLEL